AEAHEGMGPRGEPRLVAKRPGGECRIDRGEGGTHQGQALGRTGDHAPRWRLRGTRRDGDAHADTPQHTPPVDLLEDVRPPHRPGALDRRRNAWRRIVAFVVRHQFLTPHGGRRGSRRRPAVVSDITYTPTFGILPAFTTRSRCRLGRPAPPRISWASAHPAGLLPGSEPVSSACRGSAAPIAPAT